MSKKCTPLWREAHFEVKMLKTPGSRTTFGCSDVASHGRRKGLCTLSKVSKTWGFCSIFNYNHHCITLHSNTLHYTTATTTNNYTFTTFHYTPLHYTALNYTQLHYTTLHYTTLHYTTLHYTTPTTLHYITLHSTTLQLQLHNYTPLHYTTLHYTTLRHLPLHFTTLHYTPLQIQLQGNGADRRLVVLRACAWISHWNCLCSVARLFLDVLKTTSTIEQFAHGCKFLWIIAAQFGSAPHPLPDPLLQFWGVGHQVNSASFFGSFLGKPALQRFPIWINGLCSTDQRHMNVSIPPHPTPWST